MLSFLDPIRDVTSLSVIVRLLLAVLFGGMIGIERSRKRRPAGFRTHILICLGAAMTTLTSQYILLVLRQYTDAARLGAQVVAGISFIGAGSIIVTGHRRVKGLTTAAGLWAAAIVGLCCGAGFYEGAVIATILIMAAELLFSRLEYRILGSSLDVRLLIQYEDTGCLNEIVKHIHDMDVKILDLDIQKDVSDEKLHACAGMTLQLPRKLRLGELIKDLHTIPGVFAVEEV